jgi:hypothetical protein
MNFFWFRQLLSSSAATAVPFVAAIPVALQL